MRYSNPELPEGINTSKESVFKEFALLSVGAFVCISLLITVLIFSGSYLARFIPFSQELKWAAYIEDPHYDNAQLKTYLNVLSLQVAESLALDDDMTITLRYIDDPTVNAFATLGGNVVLYRGLLEKLDSEDALVMLLAHEYAHIAHRDPIKSIGGGLASQLGLIFMIGQQDISILGNAGILSTLRFSRKMESRADDAALEALFNIKGHLAGATQLFKVLRQSREHSDLKEPPEFLNSHPLDDNRLHNIKALASDKSWPIEGKIDALPEGFQRWLSDEKGER